MAWIESHQELAHHPKVARLAASLGVEKAAAIGYLHLFWWWCLSYAEDGDVAEFAAVEIADGAQWSGNPNMFIAALEDSGWLDGSSVHDWHDYGGKLAERRRIDAERKRKTRSQTSAGRPPDDRTDGVRRQQNSTVQQTTASADVHGHDFDVFHSQRAADAVAQRKRRGLTVRSDSGLARTIAKDAEFRAESERLWAHRDCKNCKGKGFTETYAPGAGQRQLACESPV